MQQIKPQNSPSNHQYILEDRENFHLEKDSFLIRREDQSDKLSKKNTFGKTYNFDYSTVNFKSLISDSLHNEIYPSQSIYKGS